MTDDNYKKLKNIVTTHLLKTLLNFKKARNISDHQKIANYYSQ
jgi:hypothetical protein